MHLLIDGYNLLHSYRLIYPLNPVQLQWERERLIHQLAFYSRSRSCGITVVFDGWQGGWPIERREKQRGIEIIYSRVGEKADEVIKRLIRERGAGTVVISSDREIAKFASRFSVAVISSEQFQERLMKVESTREKGTGKEEEEEEYQGSKKKGPSRRLSKRERRLREVLKKL